MISRASFDYVRDLVAQRAGFRFESGLEYLLEARLLPLARGYQAGSVNEFIRKLQSGAIANAEQALLEVLTDKETSFFRDFRPFETLRRSIIPELAKKRAEQRRLSILCIGCSTGQEPYSIALLLREHFPDLRSWNVQIVASDISTEALEVAKSGLYNQVEVNRGLPSALLVKYFQKESWGWRLKKEICQMVQFSPQNLVEKWPSWQGLDFVVLRYVLNSFTPEIQTATLKRVRRRLQPDGYLILGNKEAPAALGDLFEEVRFDKLVFYRPKPGVQDTDDPDEDQSERERSMESWMRLARLAARRGAANSPEVNELLSSDEALKARLIDAVRLDIGDKEARLKSLEEALPKARKEQLFAVAVANPVAKAINESFLNMLSAGVESVDSSSFEAEAQEVVKGTVKFSGLAGGRLSVRFRPDLAKDLTVEALGLNADDVGPEVVDDLIGQVVTLVSNTVNSSFKSAGLACHFEAVQVTRGRYSSTALPPKAVFELLTFQYQRRPVWVDIIVTSLEQK